MSPLALGHRCQVVAVQDLRWRVVCLGFCLTMSLSVEWRVGYADVKEERAGKTKLFPG